MRSSQVENRWNRINRRVSVLSRWNSKYKGLGAKERWWWINRKLNLVGFHAIYLSHVHHAEVSSEVAYMFVSGYLFDTKLAEDWRFQALDSVNCKVMDLDHENRYNFPRALLLTGMRPPAEQNSNKVRGKDLYGTCNLEYKIHQSVWNSTVQSLGIEWSRCKN